jgi:hypothetical protein
MAASTGSATRHRIIVADSVEHPPSLTELANKYGSDKGDAVFFRHNYTALYDLIFAPLRLHRIRLLEIGLAVGGPEGGGPIERIADAPSIAMWLDYFPYGEIYGFDISDFSHIRHPRFTFVRGDLGSHEDLARLAAVAPQFDIVIDDGSHASYHQQLALGGLFRRLAPGGLYVIEDLQWQSPVYEAALPAVPKTAALLHDAFVQREHVGSVALPAERLRAIRQRTQSFALFPSFCADGHQQKLAVLRRTDTPVEAVPEATRDTLPAVRSFDLFDTLVARRCVDPHAVFRAMEHRAACPGFAADRIAAEATLYGTPYTLDDIYARLAQQRALDAAETARLRDLELAIEREVAFPVARHCAEFAPGDIIVSDMYLPHGFLHEIVQNVCGLSAARMFVSADGKRSGRIWPIVRDACIPTEHVGDNAVTDLQSAQVAGIAARLTTITRRTAIEAELAASGYEPLANLVREARLRLWAPDPAVRDVQRLQLQANLPLLFVATLQLVELAERHGWRRVLFSGRDCFLWTELYRAMEPLLGGAPAASYFHTSRIARAHPSPDYLAYFKALRAGEPAVVVDICGTGWSLNRLIGHADDPPPDIYLVHHLDLPAVRQDYETHAPVAAPRSPLCCIHRGINDHENEVLEELNRAPYPLLQDMAATRTGFRPVFFPDDATPHMRAALAQHHAAFRSAVALLHAMRAEEVAAMQRGDHAAMIARIYRDLEGEGIHVPHFWHQKTREEAIFRAAIERPPLELAASGLLVFAPPA